MIKIERKNDAIHLTPESYLGKERFRAYLSAVKGAGARFDREAKAQVVQTIEQVADAVFRLRSGGFEVEVARDLYTALEAHADTRKNRVAEAEERIADVENRLSGRGLSLFPFQRSGVRWLADKRKALLTDEMGLGKTIQVLVALPEGASGIVVCPASLKGNWRNELEKWRPDLDVDVLEGRNSFRWPEPNEVVILNYAILPDLDPDDGDDTDGLFDAVRRAPVEGTVLAVDEAHKAKNPKAQRTQKLRCLVDAVIDAGGRAWGVTGTPVLNRPKELWNIARTFRVHKTIWGGGWNEFVADFNGYRGRYSWQFGTPDPETVGPKLKQAMLRRERDEVLTDLPGKMHRTISVEVTGPAKEMADRLMAALQGEGKDLVDLVIDDGDAEEVRSKIAGAEEIAYTCSTCGGDGCPECEGAGVAFEMISSARAALAEAKIPAMLELVEEFEEQEEPLVIFCHHRSPIAELEAREGWDVITGDVPNARRTEIVEDFQEGRLRGVAFTQAGIEGTTLTRASHMVFVDQMWSPALNAQAEDRICRIGQDADACLYHLLVGNHPLERQVASILEAKRDLIDATHAEATQPADPSDDQPGLLDGVSVASPDENGDEPDENQPDENGKGGRVGKFRGPETDVERWAQGAILQLAADDPDRAAKRNGVGFNAFDGRFGHSLASSLERYGRLSDRQWQAAIRLAKRYPRQVGRPE